MSDVDFLPEFDSLRLQEISSGDKEFELDIINLYLDEFKKCHKKLQDSLDGGDKDKSVLYAHDIKGSSANIGAVVNQSIAYKLEKLCQEGNLDHAKNLLHELEENHLKLESKLKKYTDYLTSIIE